ncbi:arginyltransferase [Roseospira marina]|uniref:Aspartate/glutamate leucyltransferase n=1 Tax=Roseospira marina TaxID=140057 RepID=A0A5M6IIS2_9PROT|nr:arginyltransferase [Roseospira marina]KAA5607595.1 arginyltransferase [Roseospira marina]MBB4312211.1 arginine-tRNA-protein transferase [Roseospira marina]MBB5085773.1 arginine-tRNA-protein transferase [Roseospira marina]
MDQTPLKRPQFFFTTAPMPCPYLDGRLERKIVTDLTGPSADTVHDALSRAGFRRSHTIAYAPACPGCQACLPVRIVVDGFKPRGTLRRITKANTDLSVTVLTASATAEQYQLFARYQQARHGESDMALMGFFDYRSMVEDSPIDTAMAEFRDPDGTLVAGCLLDRMNDGLSAVYSFFEPDSATRRSLGTYMVLWLIERARSEGLDYVYLGYWIENSRKMSYKSRFRPLEAFGPEGWSRLDEATT